VKYDLKKESQQSRFVFAILYIKNIGFPLGTKQEDLLYDKYYRYYSYRDLLHVVGQTRHSADNYVLKECRSNVGEFVLSKYVL
jgi:hypothetical protein